MAASAPDIEERADATAADVRVLGLDVLRGGVLFGLAVLVFTPWTGWRGHAEWWGWRPSDAFFPFLLVVAGAGLALQTKRGVPWERLLRRFVSLVVVGLLVNALLGDGLELDRLRLPGVLQRIAVVGLAGAATAALLRRRWLAVTVAALGLSLAWGVLLSVAASDCPGGEPTKEGCATFLWLDTAVFGKDHVYRHGTAGHEPEGLASTIGATASFLAGFGAARLLYELRLRPLRVRAAAIAGLGAGWLVVSPVMLLFAPFGKRLWTPAFVSVNAAAALGALALLMLVFDSRLPWPSVERVRTVVAWPLRAVGRNALLAWVTLFLIDHALDVTSTDDGSLEASLLAALGDRTYTVVLLGAWMSVWCVLDRARWHVRL